MRHIVLTKLDDFPVHQTSEPISYLATSERNVYGRYWFNGYDPGGEFYFGIGFGVYPHRRVMDGALSIVRKDGTQESFRASRQMLGDRTDLRVGPMRLEILEPMRALRFTIEENKTGISADLTFRAITPAHGEPLDLMRTLDGTRRLMETSRYTQFGVWQGNIKTSDWSQQIDPARVHSVRDRSWGFRPIGEPEGGLVLPGLDQIFYLWAPITWPDRCTHYSVFEYADGVRWKEYGARFPRHAIDSGFDTVGHEGFGSVAAGAHRLKFVPGTRQVSSAEIDLVEDGKTTTISMETILRFHQSGVGYLHPTWGHGCFKGKEEITSERFNVNEIDRNSHLYGHVQNLVRARMGDQVGHGILEQMLFGPHHQYGLVGPTNPPA